MGFVVLRHVESSWTRGWTHVPCVDRRSLINCTPSDWSLHVLTVAVCNSWLPRFLSAGWRELNAPHSGVETLPLSCLDLGCRLQAPCPRWHWCLCSWLLGWFSWLECLRGQLFWRWFGASILLQTLCCPGFSLGLQAEVTISPGPGLGRKPSSGMSRWWFSSYLCIQSLCPVSLSVFFLPCHECTSLQLSLLPEFLLSTNPVWFPGKYLATEWLLVSSLCAAAVFQCAVWMALAPTSKVFLMLETAMPFLCAGHLSPWEWQLCLLAVFSWQISVTLDNLTTELWKLL